MINLFVISFVFNLIKVWQIPSFQKGKKRLRFFFNRVLRLRNSYEYHKECIDFVDYIEFNECNFFFIIRKNSKIVKIYGVSLKGKYLFEEYPFEIHSRALEKIYAKIC